jgi:hypothetical protein
MHVVDCLVKLQGIPSFVIRRPRRALSKTFHPGKDVFKICEFKW